MRTKTSDNDFLTKKNLNQSCLMYTLESLQPRIYYKDEYDNKVIGYQNLLLIIIHEYLAKKQVLITK